ncbi:hypothetical protein QBC39DRAFT_429914 [Podospora conica]|nr:hypothetical protein QBC39DRAFT_429914 [Schizothecium conicum]
MTQSVFELAELHGYVQENRDEATHDGGFYIPNARADVFVSTPTPAMHAHLQHLNGRGRKRRPQLEGNPSTCRLSGSLSSIKSRTRPSQFILSLIWQSTLVAKEFNDILSFKPPPVIQQQLQQQPPSTTSSQTSSSTTNCNSNPVQQDVPEKGCVHYHQASHEFNSSQDHTVLNSMEIVDPSMAASAAPADDEILNSMETVDPSMAASAAPADDEIATDILGRARARLAAAVSRVAAADAAMAAARRAAGPACRSVARADARAALRAANREFPSYTRPPNFQCHVPGTPHPTGSTPRPSGSDVVAEIRPATMPPQTEGGKDQTGPPPVEVWCTTNIIEFSHQEQQPQNATVVNYDPKSIVVRLNNPPQGGPRPHDGHHVDDPTKGRSARRYQRAGNPIDPSEVNFGRRGGPSPTHDRKRAHAAFQTNDGSGDPVTCAAAWAPRTAPDA